MAFKSLSKYQEDKAGDFFVLRNDGDYADVVFLYRSVDDVMVGDMHYIMSANYKGYAHCCGAGCPACNYIPPSHKYKGIKLDHKILIPLYNVTKNKIEFWDRNTFFEQKLQKDVFASFPNPSEAIFRITRCGEAGSRDTTYDIQPIYRNSGMPYEKILADFGISFPDAYSIVCKEMTPAEMSAALNSTNSTSELEDYGYVPVPRGGVASLPDAAPIEPMASVPTVPYSVPPEVAPPLAEYVLDPVPDAVEALDTPVEDFSVPADTESDDSSDSLDNVHF